MSRTKNFQIEKNWVFLDEEKAKFDSKVLSPEIVSILSNRGISSEKEALSFLNPDYAALADPFSIIDMDKAVKAILETLEKDEKIVIYGDYDVDGISSTALLMRFFRAIGVEVGYYIPSRQDEGYGLNKTAIKELAGRGEKLIITVDCGSTAIDEIKYAKSLGLRVVVTDHHALKSEGVRDLLPEAEAVVNPKRSDSEFKQELAGVGVVFYLVRALQSKMKEKFPEGQEKWFLDIAALGTICDVVPLVEDNRILTSFGLKVMQKTKLVGLKSLSAAAGFNVKDISSYQVGFLLGPRLNAAGRIDHANRALQLLITDDEAEAEKIAAELNELNLQRQDLTERILTEAKELIGRKDKGQKVFLLSDKNWPAGVVGIVASRLVEEFARPVLIMEEDGEELKGSARSIGGFNIIEALTKCSDLLIHFGGHAFAAGFKLKKEHFVLLEDRLIAITNKEISEQQLKPEIVIDKRISNKNIEQKLMQEVKQLEPFGSKNFPPIFAVLDEEIIESRLVGNPAKHLKIAAKDSTGYLKGIAFNYGDKGVEVGESASIAFYLEENIWNGNTSIEARVVDIKLNK